MGGSAREGGYAAGRGEGRLVSSLLEGELVLHAALHPTDEVLPPRVRPRQCRARRVLLRLPPRIAPLAVAAHRAAQ